MFAKAKVSQSMIDAVNKVLGEQPVQAKEELLKESWDDMVKDAKEKVKSGPKPSGGAGKKEGTRYGGSKQKDEKEDMKEELKGNQDKIDANHNGKIDGQDFAILRGKKKKMREHLDNMPFAKKLVEKELDEGLMKKAFKALTGGSDKDHLDRLKKSMYGKDSEVKYAAKTLVKHAKDPLGLKKEEVEQIDELSINTLNRVHGAAVRDANDASRGGDEEKANKRYNLAGKASNKAEMKNRALGLKPSGQHTMEEVEQIDELSKDTLGSYLDKKKSEYMKGKTQSGSKENAKDIQNMGKAYDKMKKEEVESLEEKNWIANAIKHPGAETAAAKKAGMSTQAYAEKHKHDSGKAGKRARLALTLKHMKEKFEEPVLDELINEVMAKDASAGDWIHDFVHSKNPKFAGKSTAERKKMALGAYYGKQNEEAGATTDGLEGRKNGGDENTFTHFKKKLKGDVESDPKEDNNPEETTARKSVQAKPTETRTKQVVDNLDKKYGTPNVYTKEEKEEPPFEKPYRETKSSTVTDKSGAKHTPMSRAKDLAQSALKKVRDKTKIKEAKW